jgi:tetrapyrrole methylase family protein/MazG family protein
MDRFDRLPLHRIEGIGMVLSALTPEFVAAEPQIVSAASIARWTKRQPFDGGLPPFSPHRPIAIVGVDNADEASKVDLVMIEVFGVGHQVHVVSPAREPQVVWLGELAKHRYDEPAFLLIEPVDSLASSRSPLGLHALTAILRSANGCPWDREQTHASIRSAVIEEAFEVADAIDEGDPEHLAEELGDLALQVALHAQIALEAGDFTPADVYGHINRKLVRRHPHVFGDADAATPDDVLKTWEAVKSSERATAGKPERPSDPFDRLPRSMHTLNRVASVLTDEAIREPLTESAEESIGDQLLELIERLVAGDSNPEAVLERAYRRRTAASLANS